MKFDEQSVVTTPNRRVFSDDHIERLTSIMNKVAFKKGSYLFWERDITNKMFYVMRGSVILTKNNENGKKVTLYTYQKGDLVGDTDIFNAFGRHFFNAEVIEEAEIGIIKKIDIESLLYKHNSFSIEFIQWINHQNILTQTKFRDLVFYGKQGALCSTLIRLGNSYGVKKKNGILINKKITHIDLSNYIGCTRESINRILLEMRRKGYINYVGGYILIKDLEYLKGICQCENCPIKFCHI